LTSKRKFPEAYLSALTPRKEIEDRLAAFQALLEKEDWEGALIFQDVDLFYLTGTMQQAFLWVPAKGEPILLVKKDLSRARTESPLSRIESLPFLAGLDQALIRHGYSLPERLGLELDVLPYNTFQFLKGRLQFQEALDISPGLRKQRAIKSEFEIAQMRRAGAIGRALYQTVPEMLREGNTEMELAGSMIRKALSLGDQNILRSRGFNSTAFNWHVISGPSGAFQSRNDAPFAGLGLNPAFPMGAGAKTITQGEAVLIDFGNCYNGYQVDQTRMFSIGRAPQECLKAFEALKEIELGLLDHLRPGHTAESCLYLAIKTAKKLGYENSFLGPKGQQIKFVGHGVGLEIDEFPFLAQGHTYPLEEGMTVALELKIVLEKAAVGFENTVRILKNGVEKLTTADETFIQL
jgi:Xaa-Pro dipeptidase